MARYLVYTTFAQGELERELKKLSPENAAGIKISIQRSHRLQSKQHECAVTYPDGSEGICHYMRQGPRWHVFRYERGEPDSYGRREYIARLYSTETLGRDAASVEGQAQEQAVEAFQQAIEQERREAMRATPPWSGKADPALYTLSLKRATQLAGRYALCTRLEPSGKLLAVSATFDTLEEANASWQANGNLSLVIALCCRWNRSWIPVKYNYVLPAPANDT